MRKWKKARLPAEEYCESRRAGQPLETSSVRKLRRGLKIFFVLCTAAVIAAVPLSCFAKDAEAVGGSPADSLTIKVGYAGGPYYEKHVFTLSEMESLPQVQADYTLTESAPTSASEALEQARRLCSRWGFQAEQAGWTAEDTVVTLTGSVAGLPVHNRRLTLDFSAGDGSVSLVGLWSFGTPYTTANGISITCSAADALLQFAAESGETGKIESMTAGYRMQTDSSRRIRLTPTWKIDTETGEYLVDCDKKTIIGEEN